MPDSLTPPKGATSVEMMPGVEPDDAVLQGLRHPPGARQIARVEIGGEAEFRGVRHADRVRLGREAKERRHRAEGLLPRDQHLRGDVGDHGRLEERAAERVALAAVHHVRALLHRIGDVLLDFGERVAVDQRPLIGRPFEPVADAQLADGLRPACA